MSVKLLDMRDAADMVGTMPYFVEQAVSRGELEPDFTYVMKMLSQTVKLFLPETIMAWVKERRIAAVNTDTRNTKSPPGSHG